MSHEGGAAGRAVGRRDFLLSGGSVVAIAAVAGLPALPLAGPTDAAAATAVRPPHIVYIVADDLGWKDVGFHGSDIETPNIDALAKGGVELGAFYTQPLCTPSRAALMTGRYPLRYGLQTGVIPSGGLYGLPTDEWLLPQALKEAGYETALVGKWHLGHADPKYWPRQRGFDYFYGAMVGEIDHFKHEAHGIGDWYRDNARIEEEGYDTTLFGDDAVRLIERHEPATPLFLYLAFTAPHTPYQAPPEYLDQYAGIADPSRRAYAAMITAMDDQIGRVVEALEAKGMRNDTLIVFHSDNGGTRSAKFTGESKVEGDLPPNNGPYRDGKGTLYEGGTRVVAIANWPARIAPGTIDDMVHIVDMYPTLVGLAGGSLGNSKPLDGLDVWATISERKPSPRTEVVYNVDPFAGAVRQGDWKLIWLSLLPQRLELFDLSADPSETANVAEDNPDKVKELQERITQLASEMPPPLLLADVFRLTFSAPPSTPQEYFVVSD
jgi:arylsulfatase A-like enzyme